MLTAAGDDLKIVKEDGDIFLSILPYRAHEPSLIALYPLRDTENAFDANSVDLVKILTRCSGSDTSVFTEQYSTGDFSFIGNCYKITLIGLGKPLTMRSSKKQAELYLTTLVCNINAVLLAVHGMVPPTDDTADWDTQD